MEAQVLPQTSIQQVVDQILTSRRITRRDQQVLVAQTHLNAEDQALVTQLFDRLRRGLLRVVD